MKEIKQNEILADEFRKEIEDFSSNSSNLQKREIMEQRKIFSYEEFQTIIEEYKDKIQQCESEKKEVQDMLKSIIYIIRIMLKNTDPSWKQRKLNLQIG